MRSARSPRARDAGSCLASSPLVSSECLSSVADQIFRRRGSFAVELIVIAAHRADDPRRVDLAPFAALQAFFHLAALAMFVERVFVLAELVRLRRHAIHAL